MDADRRIAFFMNDFSSIWAVPPNTDLTNLVSHQEALFNGWITIPGAGPNNLANAPQMLSTVNQPNGMAMFIPGSQFHGQYRPPLTPNKVGYVANNQAGMNLVSRTVPAYGQYGPQTIAIGHGIAVVSASSANTVSQLAPSTRAIFCFEPPWKWPGSSSQCIRTHNSSASRSSGGVKLPTGCFTYCPSTSTACQSRWTFWIFARTAQGPTCPSRDKSARCHHQCAKPKSGGQF